MEVYYYAPLSVALVAGTIGLLIWGLSRVRLAQGLSFGGAVVSIPQTAVALGARDVGGELEIERGGALFRVKTSHHGKTGPQWAWLGAQIAPRQGAGFDGFAPRPIAKLPKGVLRLETRWDRRGKRWGLNLEPQTGEPAFDEAVYIETSDAPELLAILSSPGVARAVYDIVTRTGASVTFNMEGYAVALRFSGALRPFDPQALSWAMDALAHLLSLLPPFERVQVDPPTGGPWRVMSLSLLGSVAVVAVLAGIALPLDAYAPLDPRFHGVALPAALSATLSCIAAAWLASRRRPRGLVRFALFGAAALALAPGAAVSTLCVINAVPDRSSKEIRATVVDKDTTTGKKHRYYLQVEPFGDLDEPVRFEVSYVQFQRAQKGSDVHLTIGTGALGFPWLRELRGP